MIMNFNFPSLTPGYIGISSNNLTLNSLFYYTYGHDIANDSEQYILFPQRVAKHGFHHEIYTFETKEAQRELIFKKNSLVKKLHELALDEEAIKCGWPLINQLNLILRYGIFDVVLNFHCPHETPYEILLEINLIKIHANIQSALSTSYDAKIDLTDLINLADAVFENNSVSNRLKIIIFNSLIVYYCRFNSNKMIKIQKYSDQFLSALENINQSNVLEKLRLTVALRGVAMIHAYGEEKQNKYLLDALEISENLSGKNPYEDILIKENLYTLSQTLSKWFLQKNDLVSSKKHLLKMTEIDPFDSTGFTELGLFLFNQEKYNEAISCFKKAVELGPPATSMNMYFYGECLKTQKKHKEAIIAFKKSILFDETAIDAWLMLLEQYAFLNDNDNHSRTAKLIYNNLDLREQLNEIEERMICNLAVG